MGVLIDAIVDRESQAAYVGVPFKQAVRWTCYIDVAARVASHASKDALLGVSYQRGRLLGRAVCRRGRSLGRAMSTLA